MRFLQLMLVLVLFFSAAVMVGCNRDKVTSHKLRKNLTPELYSTADTREQYKNRIAVSIDHTSRQASDDLAWLLLLDKPLHLTEYPIP